MKRILCPRCAKNGVTTNLSCYKCLGTGYLIQHESGTQAVSLDDMFKATERKSAADTSSDGCADKG